ncbi:MAG TPA: cytochrome c oxidase subunit 3 [Acidobacteriaceae bacterium]|jgi:cytochrome c oxidase subunit 3
MPTTTTPPELDRRHDDLYEGDNGSGRRPPNDKRTGGNGDGDNWNDQPQGRRGPRERLNRARAGLFFGLFAIFMFFVAVGTTFFVRKANAHVDAYSHWVNDWLPTAIPSILWLNTAVLLLSSISAEFARRSMFRENDALDEWFGYGRPTSRRAAIWLSVTLLLGSVFLAGQWVAWNQLAAQHTYFRGNPSSHFFYILTAMHAIHLLLGVGALIAALIVLRRARQFATRQVFVDTTAWYWHAMGFLWILLFLLLEYGQ